ncbi:MAG TPA: heme exporter protein CcmB [Patescibacteria group bacterium]|nr:heme exporter protein CcmB [Patescibacteria group bacterium]
MPDKSSIWDKPLWTVLTKDLTCEFRSRQALGSLGMFALITLACVSMSLGGAVLEPQLAAALLWVVLFFAAMAGLARSFVQEQETGTLFTLRLYASAPAVFFGKLMFNLVLLMGLTAMILPLFVILLNVDVLLPEVLLLTVLLGNLGIGTVSTLTAAMLTRAQGKGALFTVLTFPVLLPQFLSAVSVTTQALNGAFTGYRELLFMAGYDGLMLAAAMLLFDILWQD